MKNAVREGDQCDHPAKLLARGVGSPDVFVNWRSAWRTGDAHRCRAHGVEKVKRGIARVFINNRRAVGAIDYLLGGGVANRIATGSGDVFYGERAFGTASKALQAAWCRDFTALRAKWPTMTVAQRKRALSKAIRDHAVRAGMPAPRVTYEPHDDYGAAWYWWEWRIDMSTKLYSKAKIKTDQAQNFLTVKTPSDLQWCRIGNAVAHELRHQETSWYALRKMVRMKPMSAKVREALRQHPRAILLRARKKPLVEGSEEQLFAENSADDYYIHPSDCSKSPYADTPGGREAAETQGAGCCGLAPPEKLAPKPPVGEAVEAP